MTLTIEGLIAVLSFGIGCFALGYAIAQNKNDRPSQGNGHF